MLRALLDHLRPGFAPGGRHEKWHPLFEAVENFVYSSSRTTTGRTQVRDGVDVQRIMVIVWLATFPTMVWGMYNLGHQALLALQAMGLAGINDWHAPLVELLGGYDPANAWHCLWYGICFFVPIYAVTFLVGGAWEVLFAVVRRHEINEGFFVTSVLFALCCPPDIPLWQVALGISFGIVIGKEIFGGTGKNFVNPALAGRAFLYFAYPAQLSGDQVWVAVDGFTRATPLGLAAEGGLEAVSYSWLDAFLGNVPGSVGETSTLMILLGLALLLGTRVASWRIVLGVLLGTTAMAWLLNWIGSDSNPMFAMNPAWHFVIGGFAFGMTFMATEPVSGAMTQGGRWIYGALIGVMVVLIRVVNPAFPEGMMLAILFANLLAPIIDHFVIGRNIKQRLARSGR